MIIFYFHSNLESRWKNDARTCCCSISNCVQSKQPWSFNTASGVQTCVAVMTTRYSMNLFWVSLMVIETINAQPSYQALNVSEICKNVQCPRNKLCRVVRHCDRPRCLPEFACIPCVPEGIDEECNLLNYTHSVLFGDPLKPRQLTPLHCDNGTKCPYGATCAKHPAFINLGNCCYGPSSDLPVENNDEKCLLCIPECRKGFRCVMVKDKCEGAYNVCQAIPKYGRCPRYRRRKKCRRKGPRKCLHDQACPGLKKCCKTTCGAFQCRYPRR